MMYVPDSNIFSEIIKKQANENVLNLMHLHKDNIYLASTVLHELLFGVSIMPDGRRKQELSAYISQGVMVFPLLDYNKKCATIHAQIRADAQKNGRKLPFADSQIASIAIANDATLVTRNTKDFHQINNLKIEDWF